MRVGVVLSEGAAIGTAPRIVPVFDLWMIGEKRVNGTNSPVLQPLAGFPPAQASSFGLTATPLAEARMLTRSEAGIPARSRIPERMRFFVLLLRCIFEFLFSVEE
jgi:hypothetical protein